MAKVDEVKTTYVVVKENGEVINEGSVITDLKLKLVFKDRKIYDIEGSTLVNYRKDISENNKEYNWEYKGVKFTTLLVGENQYLTDYTLNNNHYEVLHFNAQEGVSESVYKYLGLPHIKVNKEDLSGLKTE